MHAIASEHLPGACSGQKAMKCTPWTELEGCHSSIQRWERQLRKARLAVQTPANMQDWPASLPV